MKKLMLLAVLAVVTIGVGQATAQPVEFSLGGLPVGKIVELPSWACGNLVVQDFDMRVPELTVKLNIPLEFYPNRAAATSHEGIWKLLQGEIHTTELRGGSVFSFYWKLSSLPGDKDGQVNRVILVVRKHCPTRGCKKLCDCQ